MTISSSRLTSSGYQFSNQTLKIYTQSHDQTKMLKSTPKLWPKCQKLYPISGQTLKVYIFFQTKITKSILNLRLKYQNLHPNSVQHGKIYTQFSTTLKVYTKFSSAHLFSDYPISLRGSPISCDSN